MTLLLPADILPSGVVRRQLTVYDTDLSYGYEIRVWATGYASLEVARGSEACL
jgi:hypothetical protein